MWNVKFNHNTPFYNLFIQTKINEQTKLNKTVVKVQESQEIYLLEGETAYPVNLNAAHASFTPIIFSAIEGNIAEVSKY